MGRIVLTSAIFLMTFSHHLMAAEAQMKKSAPLTKIDTPACIAAFEKCKNIAKSKDLMENSQAPKDPQKTQDCIDACDLAKKECSPKTKTIGGSANTRFETASTYNLHCRKLKATNTQQNKKK